MQMISFELPDSLYEQLQQLKQTTGKSRSQLVRDGLKLLISFYQENLTDMTDRMMQRVVLEQLLNNL